MRPTVHSRVPVTGVGRVKSGARLLHHGARHCAKHKLSVISECVM